MIASGARDVRIAALSRGSGHLDMGDLTKSFGFLLNRNRLSHVHVLDRANPL